MKILMRSLAAIAVLLMSLPAVAGTQGRVTGRVTDSAGNPVEGDEIICPRHGARFCVRTGAALSPSAYEPVHCFPVRVVGGIVQVRDDRFD